MAIFFTIIGIVIFLWLLEEINNKFKSINWLKFFSFLVIGSILLAVIFSFTSEGVLVIVGAYVTLVILALLFGAFGKKETNASNEQGIELTPHDIAKNLLDVLDDETIAKKTELPIDVVKILRLKN